MPLVSMRQLLDEAAKGGYGVGAFNVNNMEQIQAIMEAARETQSPVIIQASRGARAYSQDKFLYHLMLAAAELYPEIPLVMHLDHGNSFETCKSAIDLGFTSVMMDGSLLPDGKTPATFEQNVEVTREVVKLAHEKGVTVEGEIGVLGGIEDGHGAGLDGLRRVGVIDGVLGARGGGRKVSDQHQPRAARVRRVLQWCPTTQGHSATAPGQHAGSAGRLAPHSALRTRRNSRSRIRSAPAAACWGPRRGRRPDRQR